ncbi:warA [Symbiodinium pilosum]|uniref:WarA protein n=1 Tax=Symbiodinium pilosum TaxID=2952 RepID=A0A812PPD0_SYMPI|nr:warA [Symbiodinium pilosum]
MRGIPKCHQELMQANLLVKHDPSFLTIFVSHQWLGNTHPDQRGYQFRIFQKALRNVLDGKIKLELDATSQFFGHMKTLTAEYRKKLQEAYVWLDWFCVPQTEFETDPAESRMVPCGDVVQAALRPVITSVDQAEFAMPMQWLKSPVHQGTFSLDKDRVAVCNFIQEALDFKLARLSKQKNLDIYRYFAARYTDFLGLPKKRRSVEEFLSYFRFPSMEAAVRQKKGMGAMACAALSGDAGLLRQLAEAGAPMNTKLREISELDVLPDWTPLHLAAVRRDEDAEAVSALLELRADPHYVNKLGHAILGTCESARAVELLVQAGASINQMKPLTMCTPLTLACLRCPEPDVIAKLLQLRADVNLTKGGIGLTPLHSLAIYSHGNPHSLAVAEMLIEARAELNRGAQAGPRCPIILGCC